jgi:DNA helicase HerA-like ATPase
MTNVEEYIIDNSIFRVGSVVEVVGQTVKVRIDSGKNTSSILYKGDVIQNISVGGYVKIKKDYEEIIGKIEGELIQENKEITNKKYTSSKDKISRILNIKILGYLDHGKFERGIKELPLIDNTCFLIRTEEFNNIHQFVDKDDQPIKIGQLEYDDGVEISLGINKLFASHIGIFGNTGSGKSYSLAKIYRQLFKLYGTNPNFLNKSSFLLIDFNGEYIEDAILSKKQKNTYDLTTNKKISDIKDHEKLPIDKLTLENATFWSIFLEATEKTQQPFLNRAIKDKFIEQKINDEDFYNYVVSKLIEATSVSGRNIDKSIPTEFLYELANFLNDNNIRDAAHFFTSKLTGGTEQYSFNLDGVFHDNVNVFKNKVEGAFSENLIKVKELSEIKKIGLKIILKYYDEMIRGFSNREHLSPLIKRLEKRILDLEKVLIISKPIEPPSTKNLTVISLRNVNMDIRKMLPMLLVKEAYDKKKRENNKDHSLHIIVDEAHNILSGSSDRESKEWKDYRLETFEEIIKEGRKFNVFMTISSQRPSDISPTIISQLHNYFLHRLINNNDLLAVEKTIAYLDKVSADSLPSLATGTCILAGLMAKIPVVIKVDQISKKENQPQSHNINLVGKWNEDINFY